MAFEHWVAFIRGGDHSYTSEVTAREHLRCPLLWCRESFDNLTSTLLHVSKCPWLSNAWYWCPFCCRPESFMGSQEPCANPRQCNIQRKDSKLRRAVTFFKHLGLKSCSRQRTSGSSAADPTEPFDTWYNAMRANEQESEMEDTSRKHSGRAELAESSSGFRVPQSYIGNRAGNVYEMENASIDTHHAPSYPSRQEANPVSQPCEFDIEPFVTRPCQRAELASPGTSFTAIGSQFEDNLRNAEPTEEMLMSPASTIRRPFNYHSAEIITLRHSELEAPSPAYKGPDTVSRPGIVDHRGCYDNPASLFGGPPVTSGNYDDLRDATVLGTQSQVEDLCETVGNLHQEWLQRCQSTSDLCLHISRLSPQSLLDQGAQALQLVFRSRLPSTFDAVFALALFACTAAYTIHGNNSSHYSNNFPQQVINLQNLLGSESDARVFAQLFNLLFWPQCSSTETSDPHTPQHAKQPAPETFQSSLKSNGVFQECSRFLDGKLSLKFVQQVMTICIEIEYADILERSAKYPSDLPWYAHNHTANIEEMLRTIVHPLRECEGIEALHDAVNHTAMELNSGALRSVREVEVSLISNGKVGSIDTSSCSTIANDYNTTVILPVPNSLSEIHRRCYLYMRPDHARNRPQLAQSMLCYEY